MDEKLLKDIIKTRNAIRKKYRAIKSGRTETESQLEETFKPITKPLHELVTKVKNEPLDIIKTEPKEEQQADETMTPPRRKYFKMEATSTPTELSSYTQPTDDDEFATPTRSLQLAEQASFNLNSSNVLIKEYIRALKDKDPDIDTSYGVYINPRGDWMIGNSKLKIDGDNIIVKAKAYKITKGLCELLFKKIPKDYNDQDKVYYRKILEDTSAHKRDFISREQIKGNNSYKYRNIIKKLIHTPKQRKGKGLMQIPKNQIDYIYWDDPNELVDRLHLLIASQQAGNNSHNNEIIAIIEELREADIIV